MTEAAYIPRMPPGEDELPYSDGVPVESETHRKQRELLTHTLERAWDDRTDFYVGADMFVYYSDLQIKKNDFRGPDVFVVLDTVRRVRKSWVVWGESGRTPDVVIELLSPSTEDVDRGEKMRIYAKLLHVPHYYLFDPDTGVLEGYMLDSTTREYTPMSALPNGDLACPVLGLRLGVRHGSHEGIETDWLRWLDAEGTVLATAAEDARAASEQARTASEQARTAELRAGDAELRLAEALAELEKLKKG